MANYEKGREKEEQIVKFLQWNGFIAIASRGSHGDWDIAAIPPNKCKSDLPALIQVGPKTTEELDRLTLAAGRYFETAQFFHAKKKQFHGPLIKLLQNHRTQYITIEEFLQSFYGVKTLPFFKCVKLQEEKERLERQERKKNA